MTNEICPTLPPLLPQSNDKPGFVPRESRWQSFLYDNDCSLSLATYPKVDRTGPARVRPWAKLPSVWSCSEWGLPCRCCYQQRGALLPHHFTLTCPDRRKSNLCGRYIFCGTCRRLTPPRCYLALCPAEPGLSSVSHAIQRLSGRLLWLSFALTEQ